MLNIGLELRYAVLICAQLTSASLVLFKLLVHSIVQDPIRKDGLATFMPHFVALVFLTNKGCGKESHVLRPCPLFSRSVSGILNGRIGQLEVIEPCLQLGTEQSPVVSRSLPTGATLYSPKETCTIAMRIDRLASFSLVLADR